VINAYTGCIKASNTKVFEAAKENNLVRFKQYGFEK
jgi:hypothetical protein